MQTKFEKYKEYILIACVSFLVITICMKNSFLYPINDWDDVNTLLLVGNQFIKGKLPYQEIFEHKGIFTFFLYGFFSIFPIGDYIGIYFAEILAAFFFLLISYKTTKLIYPQVNISYPIILSLIYCSNVFRSGGSMEELFLPFTMYAMYIYLKAREKQITPSKKEAILLGIMIGIMLCTKFTLLAGIGGIYCCYTVISFKNKRWKEYIQFVIYNLLGCCVICIPCMIYLYRHSLISDMFSSYVIQNIFQYNQSSTIIDNFVFGLISSLIFLCCVILSLYQLIKTQKRYDILFIFGVIFFVTFIKRPYGYYEIPLSIMIALALPMITQKIKMQYLLYITVITIFCYLFGPNTYFMHYQKEELPQYQFAEIIKDDNFLCITALDMGFYRIANQNPPEPDVTIFNVHQKDTLNQYLALVESGQYRYIITDSNYDRQFKDYELIKEVSIKREAVFNYIDTFRLYEKKE